MTHINESVTLSIDIELKGSWELVSGPEKPKYPGWFASRFSFLSYYIYRGLTQSVPAKSHDRKVRDELIGISPCIATYGGLIYLPGQDTKSYEDSDGEAPFRQRR